MKITLKGFTESLLFALNIFIAFLLVFGDKIAIPYWLQPFGRMHPMLLHFPIVLLMLAMLLEFFRFKAAYTAEKLYQNFTAGLLLTGVLLAAVTVVMGLFLSKEEGYEGSTLQWHKWTGVSIVFISSAIYWCRNASWYKAPAARIGAMATTLCLIVAGHYGAVLTHGDNFVLSPIVPSDTIKVPVDQAVLFKDVVMPIFSQRCLNCHNIEKAKGNLILDDAESIFKGGKTGKLFVPGKPEISLLLERIHLPLDEKKHMPPKGKAQLTAEEIAVLSLWIKSNADLKRKVIELPQGDSLRILSTRLLGPSEPMEEAFEFAAADAGIISKLNNNYRAVYTIAKNSPALAVNVYNRSRFKPETLKELNEIKNQIVALNLNNLPVKDEDLKIIGGFENLRRLNLNFTEVTGSGLKYLRDLKQLRAVSLSGTRINYNAVKQLTDMASLRELALWNTNLTEAETSQLQKLNKNIVVIKGFKDDGKSPIKLNLPRLSTGSPIFRNSIALQIKHSINGVQIRYTIDGSEPDSINSPVYREALVFKEATTLKARAYKSGWYSSDVMAFNLYKSSYKPDSIQFLKAANEKYQAVSSAALIDDELGDKNLIGGKWIGFLENNMEALLFFKQPVPLRSVTLNIMNRVSGGILPPQQVEVWGGTDKDHLRLLNIASIPMPQEKNQKPLTKVVVRFEPKSIQCVKIVAKNFKKLPDWHRSKGKPAWIIVDEIFLN
jgi:uncharacterized membrane protein